MPNTNLNIRIDTEVKQAAEKVFADLGLNLSSAINIFLRQAIRVNGIPFELHNGEQVNKATVRAKKETAPVIGIIPAMEPNHLSDQDKAEKTDILNELFDYRTE